MWRRIMRLFRPDPSTENHDREIERARRAREQAEQDLKDAQDRWPEVERIAGKIREIRQANHLVELFEESIRRRESGHG